MPLPPGLSTVTVTGTYKHPDGTPYSGRIVFQPEPGTLTSAAHDTLIVGDAEVVLDNNGTFTVSLLATDDPDVTPVGWTYRVTERWYDAPGRSYPLSLPAATPTVDLADVAPTAPSEGEYVVVTGPAGPEGPEGPKGDAGDPATNLVQSVNGKQGIVVLVAGDVGADLAGAAAEAVAAHVAAADPHGDRAWADGQFATITVVTTLTADVAQLDGFVQDCLTRVSSIEQGTAFLAALNVAGNAQIANGNLTVTDFTKGYRFRVDGSALDLEATGKDLIVSVWSGTGFNGTQHSYDRYAADALAVQHAGKREWVDALYGTVRHTLDGSANTAGFFGATPVGRPTVTGSWSDGTAGQSLAAALDALGLIDDQGTA
jgi:hypothetical protein